MKRVICTGFILSAALCSLAGGRTIYVDDDGPADFNNIQAAIDDANHGDTVVVKDGLYTGDGNRDIDFLGNAITVKSENGPWNCIIDCNGSESDEHRGFVFGSGEEPNSVVDGFTIRNGYSSSEGGGIHGGQTRATVTNCVVAYNFGGHNGGGISYLRGTVSNCVIYGNFSGGGGGLDNCGGQVVNCTIVYNTAVRLGGGLISCGGKVSNCIIWGNEPDQIFNSSVPTFSCIQGGADSEGNIDQDPLFIDPNGGNYHLRADSPCVNAGCSGFSAGVDVDIDRQPRILDGQVDMGADEYAVVTRPSEGEVWCGGSVHEVKWPGWNAAAAVDILLSSDSGAHWQIVEANVPGTGSYTWTLPDLVDSNHCVIKVIRDSSDANSVSAQSGLFTIHPDSPGPAAESEWRTLGGDFERRGLSENAGVELGCVKWEFEVDGAISASVTVGPNDVLYVPCEDGNLYCLDSNGLLLWSYEANTPLISSASIGADGTAYVGGRNGRLYAVDKNGSLRWTHTTGGFVYSSPAVGADGKVFVGSEDGKVYGLGPDGSELWSFETGGFGVIGGAVLSSPSLGPDGTVYVGGLYDSNLYALEPNDANVKWVCHFDSGGWCFASPVVGPNGTIYQTLLYDPNLYAIDPNDGNIISQTNLSEVGVCRVSYYSSYYYSPWFEPYEYWDYMAPWEMERFCGICLDGYRGPSQYEPPKYNLSDSGWSEPVVGPDGTIYVNLDDPWLRAAEPNGAMKWAVELGSMGGFSMTVGAGGLIYAASSDSNLYAVHPDGYEVARFDSNDHWLGFPVVSAENTVIVGDTKDNALMLSYENNKVWAIGPCQGQEADMYWQGGREDLDGDGDVDYADVRMMADEWLKCTDCGNPHCHYRYMEEPYRGDLNNDRYINLTDFALMAQRWLMGY